MTRGGDGWITEMMRGGDGRRRQQSKGDSRSLLLWWPRFWLSNGCLGDRIGGYCIRSDRAFWWILAYIVSLEGFEIEWMLAMEWGGRAPRKARNRTKNQQPISITMTMTRGGDGWITEMMCGGDGRRRQQSKGDSRSLLLWWPRFWLSNGCLGNLSWVSPKRITSRKVGVLGDTQVSGVSP